MALSEFISLFEARSITTDTTTTSSTVSLPDDADAMRVYFEVSGYTDGTYDCLVDHSPDGTNWVTDGWPTSALSSATFTSSGTTARTIWPKIRARVVSTSVTTGASVTVRLWFGRLGRGPVNDV